MQVIAEDPNSYHVQANTMLMWKPNSYTKAWAACGITPPHTGFSSMFNYTLGRKGGTLIQAGGRNTFSSKS